MRPRVRQRASEAGGCCGYAVVVGISLLGGRWVRQRREESAALTRDGRWAADDGIDDDDDGSGGGSGNGRWVVTKRRLVVGRDNWDR